MVIHGITDIREFYNGDARFLEQFPHFGDQGMSAFLEGRLAEKEEKPIKEEAPKKQKNGAELVAGGEIDISKLDIRVGTVVKAWKHEEAQKLYCEEV